VPEVSIRAESLPSIMWEWASKDPAAATAQVLGLPAGGARDKAITYVVGAIAEKDIEGAKRLIEQLPPGGARTGSMQTMGWSLLANSGDPKPFVEYVLTMPPGEGRNNILSRGLRSGWDVENPEQSLKYLNARLPADGVRHDIIGRTLQTWSSSDPKAALDWAVKTDPGVIDDQQLREAVNSWASMDSEGALSWSRSQTEGPRKAALLAGVITGLAQNEPTRAAELFQSLPPGQQQNDAAGSIAGRWAQRDPSEAARWTTTLPEGEARNGAIRQLIGNWAEYNITAAAKWVEGLPVGGSRDAAAGAYADNVIRTDPEGAVAWAATIADVSQRENALRRTFEKWKTQDEAAAKRWLEASPALTQEAKQRLLAK
jgi:hypothetical protein